VAPHALHPQLVCRQFGSGSVKEAAREGLEVRRLYVALTEGAGRLLRMSHSLTDSARVTDAAADKHCMPACLVHRGCDQSSPAARSWRFGSLVAPTAD
jgi:hypothetical protein